MKTALIFAAALIAVVASASGLAQSIINIEPVAGATIQQVYTRSDGYGGIILAESYDQMMPCAGTGNPAYGSFLGSSKILWFDLSRSTGKQLQSATLAAFYAGKKLAQVVFFMPFGPGYCELYSIRVGP